MAWATVEEAFDITMREVTPGALNLAQVMIELFAGTTEFASEDEMVSSRNLRLLQQAVAFQGAWLDSHPDVLDAMDVEGISQDGLSAQYASANAHLLAPLAARCLARLSWKHQIRVGRGNWSRRRVPDNGNRDSAVRDDQYEWSALPFGASPPAGSR